MNTLSFYTSGHCVKINLPAPGGISALLVTFLLFFFSSALSQSLQIDRRITMKDGLPSNQVYKILQDKQGFLWFATDNGLSRYDGKDFKNFGMSDGLPDHEIFDIVQDKEGVIWVCSHKAGIAYFDAQNNKFNIPKGGNLVQSSAYVFCIKPLDNGVLVSDAHGGDYLFRNKQLVSTTKSNRLWEYQKAGEKYYLYPRLVFDNKGVESCYAIYERDNFRDSILLIKNIARATGEDVSYILLHDTLYVTRKTGKLYVVTVQNDRMRTDSIVIKNRITHLSFCNDKITLSTSDGSFHFFDKKSRMLIDYTELNEYIGFAYADNSGNIWAATLGRGVIKLKKNYVQSLPTFSEKLDQRFRSISIDKNDNIYVGNYFGDVIKILKNQKSSVYYLPQKKKNYSWTRNVIGSAGKVFVFYDVGGFVNYSKPILLSPEKMITRIKSCMAINDSTIILGIVNTTEDGGLYELNTKTEVVRSLKSPVEWVSSLSHLNNRFIYFGSANGLHKYDFKKKQYLDVFSGTPLRSQRTLFTVTTKDSLVIAATTASGIYFIKNDKILANISYRNISNYLPICAVADSANNLWIGTKGGLIKVSCFLAGSTVKYSRIDYASLGFLLAADINAMVLRGDQLYLATGQGVGVFNTSTAIPSVKINPILTEVKVNQTPYSLSDSFNLATNQNSIALTFSGVEVNGDLKMLQYSLDTTKRWLDLPKNILNLELDGGAYNIWVRAITKNGNISSQILHLYFDIKRPLYLHFWFVALITACIVTFFAIIFNRIKGAHLRKKERERLKIEQERNRITADLHDEIGASLSSLQIYSDVALQELDKDRDKSRNMLTKISASAYKISGTIGDIIWSIRSVEESLMTIESRIKSMVNEMLGESGVAYEIDIDKRIDATPKNFLFKKNCILIIKEALNNSVKYGHPRRINIKIATTADDCIVSIKDDGKGFDLNDKIHKGNGLHIMKMRVTELGGDIWIKSSKGKGATITATLPLTSIT